MRILVIGSTSVIGRALRRELSSLGTVRTAGRRDADIPFDLTEWRRNVFDTGERFDAVVHAAADFGGPNDEDLVRAEIVNAAGTLTACRLARGAGARHFLLISTVFAAQREGGPYFGIYALSKRHGEEAARLYCDARGMALSVLRPSQVYDAAGECRRHQPFFFSIVDRAEAGQDVVIFGKHDAKRNFIHLDDLAEAVKRVVAAKLVGTFTCAHPRTVRVSEVAAAAFAAFGKGGAVRFDEGRPDLADVNVEDETALYEATGFVPAIDLREGMSRIGELRRQRSGPEASAAAAGKVGT